jgi:hypothetical protein
MSFPSLSFKLKQNLVKAIHVYSLKSQKEPGVEVNAWDRDGRIVSSRWAWESQRDSVSKKKKRVCVCGGGEAEGSENKKE